MPTHIPIPVRKPRTPPSFLVNEAMKSFIREYEGKEAFLYKDSEGNPTIGIGLMVPNLESALKLPLYIAEGEKPLRPSRSEEIREAWNRLVLYNPGLNMVADQYDPKEPHRGLINLRLRDEDMEFLFEEHLHKDVESLQRKFENYENFTRNRRMALADMEFNLGARKFTRKNWPNLYKAIEQGDWVRAAQESNRKTQGLEKRNKKIYDALLDK